MKHTKQTLLAAFQAGDITAHVLAANPGEWSDRLTHLAGLGLFRFRAVADDSYDIDDSDCYKQEANPDIEPAVMKAQRAAELRRIREYGVWGVITEVRATLADVWQCPDQGEPGSLWGNVAADFIGSGYDAEQLRAVLGYFDKTEPASDLAQDAALLARLLQASQDDNALLTQALAATKLVHPDGRAATQRFTIFNALTGFCGLTLTADRIDALVETLAAEMTTGATSWAFKPGDKPAPVLGFDGFGLNDIADGYRSRVFTLATEYKPGHPKADQGAAFLSTLEASGLITRNY